MAAMTNPMQVKTMFVALVLLAGCSTKKGVESSKAKNESAACENAEKEAKEAASRSCAHASQFTDYDLLGCDCTVEGNEGRETFECEVAWQATCDLTEEPAQATPTKKKKKWYEF